MAEQAASSEEPKPLFGDTFTDVAKDYTLGRRLGSGNFAKVVHGALRRGTAGRSGLIIRRNGRANAKPGAHPTRSNRYL